MNKEEITFKDYYQFYLQNHSKRWTKICHMIGQFATLYYLWAIIYVMINVSFWFFPALFLTPIIVYPFAWGSHFYIEKNKPLAFSRPIWAKACDWVMLFHILIGKVKL